MTEQYVPDLVCVTATYDASQLLSIEVRLNLPTIGLNAVTDIIRVLQDCDAPAPVASITGGHAAPMDQTVPINQAIYRQVH